jgi:hypothetical protein
MMAYNNKVLVDLGACSLLGEIGSNHHQWARYVVFFSYPRDDV